MSCDCCGADRWERLFTENGIDLGRCPVCDLLSIRDIPDRGARMTEVEEGHYAGDLAVLEAGKQWDAEQLRSARYADYVRLVQQYVERGRWLDVGCGAGLLLHLAADKGFEPEGLELNADRRETALQHGSFPVYGVPLEDAGLADDSVDVISLINVFSHLTSPAATFREMQRVLRPGGVALMVTGEMTAGVQRDHVPNWNLGDHLYFLGDRTMKEYGARLGFDVLHHERLWFPDELLSREWLRAEGRDPRKNLVKRVVDRTPGGLRLLRAVMLRRMAGSAAHSSTFVLRFN